MDRPGHPSGHYLTCVHAAACHARRTGRGTRQPARQALRQPHRGRRPQIRKIPVLHGAATEASSSLRACSTAASTAPRSTACRPPRSGTTSGRAGQIRLTSAATRSASQRAAAGPAKLAAEHHQARVEHYRDRRHPGRHPAGQFAEELGRALVAGRGGGNRRAHGRARGRPSGWRMPATPATGSTRADPTGHTRHPVSTGRPPTTPAALINTRLIPLATTATLTTSTTRSTRRRVDLIRRSTSPP